MLRFREIDARSIPGTIQVPRNIITLDVRSLSDASYKLLTELGLLEQARRQNEERDDLVNKVYLDRRRPTRELAPTVLTQQPNRQLPPGNVIQPVVDGRVVPSNVTPIQQAPSAPKGGGLKALTDYADRMNRGSRGSTSRSSSKIDTNTGSTPQLTPEDIIKAYLSNPDAQLKAAGGFSQRVGGSSGETPAAGSAFIAAQMELAASLPSLQAMATKGGGVQAVNRYLTSFLAKHPGLSESEASRLLSSAYGVYDETDKSVRRQQAEMAAAMVDAQETLFVNQYRMQLAPAFAALRNRPTDEGLKGFIEATIGSVMKDNRLSDLSRMEIMNTLLGDEYLPVLSQHYDLLMKAQNGANVLSQIVSIPKNITGQQRDALISKIKLEAGLLPDVNIPTMDPLNDVQYTNDTLSALQRNQELVTTGQIDRQYGRQMEASALHDLASRHATPAGVQTLRSMASQATGTAKVNLETAARLAEDMVDAGPQIDELDMGISRNRERYSEIVASDIGSVFRQAKRTSAGTISLSDIEQASLSRMLEEAGMNIQPKREYTPQQIAELEANYRKAREAQLRAIQEQINIGQRGKQRIMQRLGMPATEREPGSNNAVPSDLPQRNYPRENTQPQFTVEQRQATPKGKPLPESQINRGGRQSR